MKEAKESSPRTKMRNAQLARKANEKKAEKYKAR